ncbi:MAG: SCO family protein [Verrucomicrobiae bacterium]|nr:SCO family protein [Verrucomicrobiae bacterium]
MKLTRTSTIVTFYSAIALLSAAILGLAFYVRSGLPNPKMSEFVDVGKQGSETWLPIEKDLEGYQQDGTHVKLSDLKGKVWVAAEFFAVCPHCAVRNGEELRKLYDEFKDDPDFHIVCITVDPENDKREKLHEYAEALSADSSHWWFMNAGDEKQTHEYLEKELKFFGIRERSDPVDIETNGRFEHDLSFLLVNRDAQIIGKWNLAGARSEVARQQDPDEYSRLKKEMFDRIRIELAKPANNTASGS